MIQFIIERLITYYPAVGIYSVFLFAVIFITYHTTLFYSKTKEVVREFPEMRNSLKKMETEVEKIPRIERLIEKIDRGLSALNNALLEKDVIKHSYHSAHSSE